MDPSALRVRNVIRVLEAIMNEERTSRTDIALKTGLTKTTVSSIVRQFMDIGFLDERKAFTERVGRPSLVLKLNPDFACVAGLSIKRDGVDLCVIDSAKDLILEISRPFGENWDVERVLEEVFNALDEIVKEADSRGLVLKAIGIGTPGLVDPFSGVVKLSPKFDGFKDLPIVEIISKRYGLDAWLENDSDMAAIGEKWFGEGKNIDTFAYIYVVEGIGMGVILNGELLRGETGYTGEISHLLVPTNDGRKRLETVYGMDVLISRAKELGVHVSGLSELARKAEEKPEVKDLIVEFGEGIGMAIHSLINLLGVSTVFIGGKAPQLGNVFLNAVKRTVVDNLFYPYDVDIRYSRLGSSVVALGAAGHALEMYLQKLVVGRNNLEYVQ